jgi:hypothetical protein
MYKQIISRTTTHTPDLIHAPASTGVVAPTTLVATEITTVDATPIMEAGAGVRIFGVEFEPKKNLKR